MNEVKNPKVRKPLIYYYMMALLIMLLLNTFLFPALLGRKEVEVDYSTFTTQLAQGNIQQVEVLDQKIEYLLNDEEVLDTLNRDTTFFTAAAKLYVPIELLDFKFRVMKWKGYKLIEPPISARSNFLANMEVPDDADCYCD